MHFSGWHAQKLSNGSSVFDRFTTRVTAKAMFTVLQTYGKPWLRLQPADDLIA